MTDNKEKLYWLLALSCTVLISFYPLMMGGRVITDMIMNGTVLKEDYPKYIIPYTPIAFAVITGVLFMPLFLKLMKRYAVLGGAALSLASFFAFETLFENKVIVTTAEEVVKLENWQMFMCYAPRPQVVTEYKPHSAVEILMGEYSPAFKLHFYLISVVLILAVINSIYGFARMIKTGDKSRRTALILQTVSAATFLGLCILACFTAFWRDGSINVSPLSAVLMSVFFILLGVTVGIFAGSLLLRKRKSVVLTVPPVTALLTTLVMYIGEMILLHGHLYRFGSGFLFEGLGSIVLAPVDIIVILLSGGVTLLSMIIAGKSVPDM